MARMRMTLKYLQEELREASHHGYSGRDGEVMLVSKGRAISSSIPKHGLMMVLGDSVMDVIDVDFDSLFKPQPKMIILALSPNSIEILYSGKHMIKKDEMHLLIDLDSRKSKVITADTFNQKTREFLG